jgi:uncharacterized repeat protein (TIGR01451 family)
MSRRSSWQRETLLRGALLAAALTLAIPAAAGASGESVPLNTFDLPAGASVTVTFEVTVDSPLGVCAAAVSNQGTLSGGNFTTLATDDPDVGGGSDPTLTALDVVDLAVTKTNGTSTSVPGGMTTYTITVTNSGPSDAVGASVSDTFPGALTGVSWSCVASAGSSCTAGPVAGNISDVVTVLAGGTLTYTATGTIDPGATGSLANTATVTAPGSSTECATADNAATDTDTLEPQADLAIVKSDGQSSAVPGEPVTYTITVTNPGPSDVTGATVSDTFPGELTGVSWTCSASAGSSCTAGPVAGNISDAVNVLAGGTLTYTATGTIDPAATGSLANTATVTAPAGTVDPVGNNSSTDTDTLAPEADLAITKEDSADPPAPGDNLTYTITVDNLGASDATGVVVTDNLPVGVTLVATSGCAEDPAGAPTCTLGSIPAGGSAVYTIEVSIDMPPPSSVSNTATVSGDQTDPSAANNSDTEETTFDATPPEVESIDTEAGTGDGELVDCETARAGVFRFLVDFSEDVVHGSAADPASATNPANYRLVSAAIGSDFDTTTCAGGTGADTVVPIGAVSYDAGGLVAGVTVNGGVPIPDAQYRLLVCGTIEDTAGNQLSGDGAAGTDFHRDFRVDRYNLFDNGHFDCDLGGWSSTSPADVEHSAVDFDGSPISGSAHNFAPLVGFSLNQCVEVFGGVDYDLDLATRIDGAPGALYTVEPSCTFFDQPACGGAQVSVQSFPVVVADTGGGWLPLALTVPTPPGAVSARCRLRIANPQMEPLDGFLDELGFGGNVIFVDGFESGDTSAWSVTVP